MEIRPDEKIIPCIILNEKNPKNFISEHVIITPVDNLNWLSRYVRVLMAS